MPQIENDAATLVLTSPPYFPHHMEDSLASSHLIPAKIEKLTETLVAFALSLRSVFEECRRILHPAGTIILQTRDVRLGDVLVPVAVTHRRILETLGFGLYTQHLWKPQYITHSRRTQLQHATEKKMPRPFDPELFMIFRKIDAAPRDFCDSSVTPILEQDFIVSTKGTMPAPHKHQAPIPIIDALINAWSEPGSLVVDPFCGGGTTLLVASRLGRTAYGYEIDLDAIHMAEENIELAT